jgi:hypothetical protein
MRYREDFRCSAQDGVKPMTWTERVDGGRIGGGVADRILSAAPCRRHQGARPLGGGGRGTEKCAAPAIR